MPRVTDTVLFCHVLEVFAAEQITALLGKAYEALPSGGRALIYAFTAPDEEDRGVLAAQLSFYLNVLATGTGMAYPAADFAAWMRIAGFDVRVHTGLPYEHSIIVGVKA
jgi:cyclopropane fatty-acyl-phospholipid synthase-like methyltransferase